MYLTNSLRRKTNIFYVAITILSLKMFLLLFFFKSSDFETSDSAEYLSASKSIGNTYLNFSGLPNAISLSRLPIYPLFLNIFSPKIVTIVIQISLHLVMGIISIQILKEVTDKKNSHVYLLTFLLIQFETSLFVYSFRILSDLLFAFSILLLIYMIKTRKIDKRYSAKTFFITLVLMISILIRPTALALVPVFFCMAIIQKKKRFFIYLTLASITFIGSYSLFNYAKSGIFVYSVTQNSNLFQYEGVPSKALSSSKSLQEIQIEEENLRKLILGNNPSFADSNYYNKSRGLELILSNKDSFLKLHIVGLFKVLYGPNKSEIIQIFSDEDRFSLTRIQRNLIINLSLLLTFIISTFGIIGAIIYFHKHEIFKLMSLTIFSFLILSSGGSAYGRFRTPISSLLVIYASMLIVRLNQKRKVFFTENPRNHDEK